MAVASVHPAPSIQLWPGARLRGDQVGIRCVFMRGGTSRGAFLNAADVPSNPVLREKLILAIYGSPDVRQIDGLGGANPLTSKVAIVGPSSHPDADVDYTFGQVRIDEAKVDFTGNCGNISAGIGPFAIDEGLVPAREPTTSVRIHLTNTGAILLAEVPVRGGLALVQGEAEVAGVPGTGASILLDFGDAGSTLGQGLLPTGSARDVLQTPGGPVEVSIVDAGNPAVFVRPVDVALTGVELPEAFTPEVLARLETVRAAGAVRLGLVDSPERAADVTPAVPKVYVVSAPASYTDVTGRRIEAGQINLVGRGLSMRVPHQAYAATVAVCTAAAALLPGTLVNEVLRPDPAQPGRIRIGHPSGVVGVDAALTWTAGQPQLVRAAVERTARRIMDGTVYVPLKRLS